MLASFLIGLVGGQRAIAPLATVSAAAARAEIRPAAGPLRLLGNPVVATGLTALAAAEMAGDKQKTAPDRIVPIGLVARFATSALAGAALSPKRPWLGGALAGATAVVASFPGWRTRILSMRRYGQTPTGFVEDAAVLAASVAVTRTLARG